MIKAYEHMMGEDETYEVDTVDEVELRAEFGIVQCLPVDEDDEDDEDDEEGEEHASDGMAPTVAAYLRQVRRQARALPDVVTAKASAPAGAQPSGVGRTDHDGQFCDADRMPSMAWIRSFLTHFASLRREIGRTREDPSGSSYGGCGSKCLSALSDQSLVSLGQVRLHQLLEMEADAIETRGITVERANRVYEISALLDWPCHSNTLATLSRLVRVCSRRRSAPSRPPDSELASINIIIAICGGIFRQDKQLAGIVLVDDP